MRAVALASGELHVGAAYLLFVALVVVYVVIIRTRFTHAYNRVEKLASLVREDEDR